MAQAAKKRSPQSVEDRPTITDRAMFEIVNGRLVEMEPMSIYSVRTAAIIYGHLFQYCLLHRIGEAAIEALFRLPLPKPKYRRPDVAFVSAERWPAGQSMPLKGEAWNVVPDLVVEVISPTDRLAKLERKLDDYFLAGVRHAWVVYPEQRVVKVHDARHNAKTFTESEELVDSLLPGFQLTVSSIFPPVAVDFETGEDD